VCDNLLKLKIKQNDKDLKEFYERESNMGNNGNVNVKHPIDLPIVEGKKYNENIELKNNVNNIIEDENNVNNINSNYAEENTNNNENNENYHEINDL
jgi:hypothetical protein